MKNTKKGNNINKALLMGTALVALSSPQVANAATGTGAMSAIILTPIDITTNQVLHFGQMTVDDATGTVTIDADGVTARASTGGVTLVTGSGLENEGQLVITAATGINMDVALNTTVPAFTAGYEMSDTAAVGPNYLVDNFEFRNIVGATSGTAIVVSQTGANVVVPVGATMNVPIGQGTLLTTGATYRGNYTVDVNYQ